MARQKNKFDPQFEIDFYEGVLQRRPQFVEALMALGDLYTKEGHHRKGLDVDQRLSQLRPQDPIVFYNLACSYSLLEDNDRALEAIQKAVAYGYEDFEFLQEDGDLENLRKDIRFQRYWQTILKNQQKQS